MTFFVHFQDGDSQHGGVGFKQFSNREEAAMFIQDRMARAPDAFERSYRVVEGIELKHEKLVKPVTVRIV